MDADTRVYELLASALDALPNRFPRTRSGIELQVLRRMYPLEQAKLACLLTAEPLSATDVAAAAGLPVEDVEPLLREMTERGLVWPGRTARRGLGFRLAPFIVGAYESQLETIDHELAHLIEHYFTEGGLAGIMKPGPALHRVIPASGTVKSEWILPYDELKPLLERARSFDLHDCICRTQQALIGEQCRFPLRTCLSFSGRERPAGPTSVTREQALEALAEFEQLGLVHTVSNIVTGLTYVCNCCTCCCGILRGVAELGIRESVAQANYVAVLDVGACAACGVCVDRCPFGARVMRDGVAAVERDLCLGCGLCVSTCPTEATTMQLRPAAEVVEPPADFGAWEAERQRGRVS